MVVGTIIIRRRPPAITRRPADARRPAIIRAPPAQHRTQHRSPPPFPAPAPMQPRRLAQQPTHLRPEVPTHPAGHIRLPPVQSHHLCPAGRQQPLLNLAECHDSYTSCAMRIFPSRPFLGRPILFPASHEFCDLPPLETPRHAQSPVSKNSSAHIRPQCRQRV